MVTKNQQHQIEENRKKIWDEIKCLKDKPIYPAIVRKVMITPHEEEYIDHDLGYDEKYAERLELREGFIVGHVEHKSDLLGIGDAIILDIAKHALLRAPRATRCGLVLPMISYQGHTSQPMDYLTYFEDMLNWLDGFKESEIKESIMSYKRRS